VLRGGGGTGKTVAAAQVATAYVDGASAGQRPTAVWVRCGVEDSGVAGVWKRVARAVVDAGIAAAGSPLERLAAGGLSSAGSSALIAAVNALGRPLLLVLDDAHRAITREVESNLVEVLEGARDLTVVITTRDALPKLTSADTRLRFPVTELQAADLALAPGEIEAMLDLRAPDLEAAEKATALERVVNESAGWPLAVHALLLERASGAPGDAHYGTQGAFVRGLVERILETNPPSAVAAFCAAALFEEVSVRVLADMFDYSEDEAASILEGAHGAGFTSWVDDAGVRWYRQHDLIGEELRRHAHEVLGAERMVVIAGRAARAFRASRPRSAMQAAILAEDWELLAEILLEGSALTLSRRQSGAPLTSIPRRVLEQHPVIAAFALIHEYAFPSGRIGQALNGLKILASHKLAAESRKPGLPGLTAALLRMIVARLSGNGRVALEMSERAREELELLSDDELVRYRMPLQTGIGQIAITLMHSGRFGEASRMLEPVHVWENAMQPKSRAHIAALDAWSHAWSGQMPQARELIREAERIDIPVGWHDSYIGAGYRIAAALEAIERGETVSAAEHLEALSEHEATIEHWPFLTVLRTLITESRSGVGAALDALEHELARRRGRSAVLPAAQRMLRALRARLLWHSGRVLPAEKRRARPDLSAMYAALSRGDHALALAYGASIDSGNALVGIPRARSEVLLLQAETARRDGDLAAAARFAENAAEVLRQYDLTLPVRVLPAESARELQALVTHLPTAQGSRAVVRTVRPLTPGEQRALIGVVEHGSIPAAARVLHLSPETVKGHMKQVYRKLGVNKRRDVVRVAAEAGLLQAEALHDDGDQVVPESMQRRHPKR